MVRSRPFKICLSPTLACKFLISSINRTPYPTLPSRLRPIKACASTANSMGNSLNTSLQKPLTIIEIASSADKIGRASCRERVEITEVAEGVKRKETKRKIREEIVIGRDGREREQE